MLYMKSKHYSIKTGTYYVDKVNLVGSSGTCTLVSSYEYNLIMVWSIENYPMETAGMPGAPFPVLFKYTIFSHGNKPNDNNLRSISGEIVFEVNSGTLPNNNSLGVPFGTYYSLGRNTKRDRVNHIVFSLNETNMKVTIH